MPPRARNAKAAASPERTFEALRQRAANVTKKTPQVTDFVLGKDDGFDPEIRVKFPMGIKQQEQYYYAARHDDMFGQVRAILGDVQYARVMTVFDAQDDSTELFLGFFHLLLDHVSGKGAGDVEGGSGRS